MNIKILSIATISLTLAAFAHAQADMAEDETTTVHASQPPVSESADMTGAETQSLPQTPVRQIKFLEKPVAASETSEKATEEPDKSVPSNDVNAMKKSGEETPNEASTVSDDDSIIIKITSNQQKNTKTAHIIATGVGVEETTSPDGATRIIRVTSPDGSEDTIITITK